MLSIGEEASLLFFVPNRSHSYKFNLSNAKATLVQTISNEYPTAMVSVIF